MKTRSQERAVVRATEELKASAAEILARHDFPCCCQTHGQLALLAVTYLGIARKAGMDPAEALTRLSLMAAAMEVTQPTPTAIH